jgi:hypothetical protein
MNQFALSEAGGFIIPGGGKMLSSRRENYGKG